MVSIVAPVETVSEMNRRDHWSARHRRAKQQKEVVTLLLRTAKFERSLLVAPFEVTLTRLAPGAIRDSDNLASATKAVRDAVASFLGVDDQDLTGTPAVTWSLAQERSARYAVRVEIRSLARRGDAE